MKDGGWRWAWGWAWGWAWACSDAPAAVDDLACPARVRRLHACQGDVHIHKHRHRYRDTHGCFMSKNRSIHRAILKDEEIAISVRVWVSRTARQRDAKRGNLVRGTSGPPDFSARTQTHLTSSEDKYTQGCYRFSSAEMTHTLLPLPSSFPQHTPSSS